MDAVELKLLRAQTTEFIAWRPTSLVLTPQTRTRLPSGGFKDVPGQPRSAQTVRIIEPSAPNVPLLRTQDGTQREVAFFLLLEHDAEIAVNDFWKGEDGRTWIVDEVVRANGYETRGLVVERGK